MKREDLEEYLRQAGFLQFEINQLVLILRSLDSDGVSRMIADRKAMFLNFKERIWTRRQFEAAVSKDYAEKEAYILDGHGHRHADPSKLLAHYKTFNKQDEVFMKMAQKQA